MAFETVAVLLMVLIGFQAPQHQGSIHKHSSVKSQTSRLPESVQDLELGCHVCWERALEDHGGLGFMEHGRAMRCAQSPAQPCTYVH